MDAQYPGTLDATLFAVVCIIDAQYGRDTEGDCGPLWTRSLPIHDLNRDDAELVESIQVEIECYRDEFVAKVPELDLWASEPTESEALLAIKQAIGELWEELCQEEDANLGKLPRMWKRILTKKIRVHVTA